MLNHVCIHTTSAYTKETLTALHKIAPRNINTADTAAGAERQWSSINRGPSHTKASCCAAERKRPLLALSPTSMTTNDQAATAQNPWTHVWESGTEGTRQLLTLQCTIYKLYVRNQQRLIQAKLSRDDDHTEHHQASAACVAADGLYLSTFNKVDISSQTTGRSHQQQTLQHAWPTVSPA